MDNQLAYKIDAELWPDDPVTPQCEDMFHEYFGTKLLWVEKIGRRVGVTHATLRLAALTAIMKKGANVIIFTENDLRNDDNLLYHMLSEEHPYLDIRIHKGTRTVFFERSQSTIRFINGRAADIRYKIRGVQNLYIFAPAELPGTMLGAQKKWGGITPVFADLFPLMKKLVLINDITGQSPKLDATRRYNLVEMGFTVVDSVNLQWLERQQAQGTRVI